MIRDYVHYGMENAAVIARALGKHRLSAVEFGVAGGNGLVAMEESARIIAERFGVEYQIYGFDLECGMPPAKDYRDLPYSWSEGFFKMDRDKLEARLSRSRLVLGNVGHTVGSFFVEHDPAPIGFIAFDLDYYSSTVDAFGLFAAGGHDRFLPRVFCYFDDVVGDAIEIHCDYVGELLAIKEYNAANDDRKICPISGLSAKLGGFAGWHVGMYVHHRFSHPQYNTSLRGPDWQLPLV